MILIVDFENTKKSLFGNYRINHYFNQVNNQLKMKRFLKILPALLVLIIGVIVSFWIQQNQNEADLKLKTNEIEFIVDNDTKIIQQGLLESFSTIEILKNLFEKHEVITQKEFKDYTAPLLRGNPSVKALSWVPKIMLDEKQAFETRVKNELKAGFEINQRNRINEIFPAEDRPFYFPIKYIEPIEGNSNILGYDLYSSGARKAAINRVINSGEIHLTSRVKLNQDTIGYSVLGLIPVFHNNEILAAGAKIENLKGIISAVFKAEEIIARAIVNKKDSVLTMVVYDISNNKREYIYGDESLLIESNLIQISTVAIADREWEINFVIDPEFVQSKNSESFFLIGIIISFLLFLLLLFPFIKEERNRILSQKLKKEKSDRERTEHSLSESEDYNRALFSQTTIGLALASMDGQLVDINDAFAQIIGYSVEEARKLTYWEITPEKYKEQENQQLESLEKTGYYGPFEKEYIHKKGHLVPIKLQGRIIELKGEKYIWSSVEDISSQKKFEEKAKESDRRFNEILKSVNLVSIILDSKGNIEFCNDYLLKITGYSEEDILGKSWFDVFIPNEISAKVSAVFLDAISNRDLVTWMENEIVDSKGNRLLISWNNTLLKNIEGRIIGVASLGEDITERKKAEENLILSEGRYRTLFEQAPDGILIADTKSYYLNANVSMCKMLGYKRNEIIGLHATDIVVPAEFKHIDPALEEIQTENQYQREWSFKRKDGTTFIADVQVTQMPDGNLLAIVRDITESKKAEEKIKKLNEELEQKVKERTKELEEKYSELERMNKLFVGRELRMVELKKTIEQLKKD